MRINIGMYQGGMRANATLATVVNINKQDDRLTFLNYFKSQKQVNFNEIRKLPAFKNLSL